MCTVRQHSTESTCSLLYLICFLSCESYRPTPLACHFYRRFQAPASDKETPLRLAGYRLELECPSVNMYSIYSNINKYLHKSIYINMYIDSSSGLLVGQLDRVTFYSGPGLCRQPASHMTPGVFASDDMHINFLPFEHTGLVLISSDSFVITLIY